MALKTTKDSVDLGIVTSNGPAMFAFYRDVLGFESLWVPEHTHIPVPADGSGVVRAPTARCCPRSTGTCRIRSRRSPRPPQPRHAELGTSICLVNQHHPIVLAKQVATLDQLSDGRLIFGAGAGWNKGEMGHHGVRFEDRWAETAERIAALKALWTEEQPSFAGKFVRFDPLWCYPKPVQKPHPPIVLGTPIFRPRRSRLADGWLPLTFELERARQHRRRPRAHAHAGRDPAKLAISLFFLETRSSRRPLRAARDLGVERAILRLPVADEAEVLIA
jgi:probable F420-dependent oxidoreductase